MAAANPFEDPDVKQAASNNNAYANDAPAASAYDDAPQTASNDAKDNNMAQYIPSDQTQTMAINAGTAAAKQTGNQIKNEYNNAMAEQGNHNAAPDAPDWCGKWFNWFPLRWFALFGGFLLFAMPVVDMVTSDLTFIAFFIYLYLMVFGVVIMFAESPSWRGSRWAQLQIFFWFRYLSRMFGRSWFYLFVSLLCYTEISSGNVTGTFFVGMYLTAMAFIGFFYSRLAAKKYVRMFIFHTSGSEGEEMEGKLTRKFDELDQDGDGRIGSQEIVLAAKEASRDLSNTERHAIQTFLDESCFGAVSKEDWLKQFTEHNLKQHFL